jgi:hypothetical protein
MVRVKADEGVASGGVDDDRVPGTMSAGSGVAHLWQNRLSGRLSAWQEGQSIFSILHKK